MQNYLILLAAAFLLAGDFAIQKLYQQKSGTGIVAGLSFNMIVGLATAIIFFCINGFSVNISLYGMIISSIMSVSVFLYTIIGFRILKYGNIALYSLFSLMGAIVVPYVFGITYLKEESTTLMFVGVVLIVSSAVVSNFSLKKSKFIQFVLCIAVFFLNGFGAVVSKMCQVDFGYGIVGVNDFVCMTGIAKFIICAVALGLYGGIGSSKKRKAVSFKVIPIIVLSAAVGGVSYMLQLMGAARLPASLLFPMVSGASMILSALAGALFFKEKLSKRQMIGIGVCFVGTLLLV